MKIKLTWFKATGKFYTGETLTLHEEPNTGLSYHEILDWVRGEKKYDHPAPICHVEIEGNDEPRIIIFGRVEEW